MWQRFTERARKVVFYAQEEAQKFGEGYVSTEHLLLGLVREPDSVAARVLEKLGVSLSRIRAEVEKQLPRGESRPSQDMTLTPRAKRVIDLAYDEARNLDNNYIGTEHILLGLTREGDGLAGRVLAKLGVEHKRARQAVIELQDKGDRGAETDPTIESLASSARRTYESQPMQFVYDLNLFSMLRERRLTIECLLLMLLADPESEAFRVLSDISKNSKNLAEPFERLVLALYRAPSVFAEPSFEQILLVALDEERGLAPEETNAPLTSGSLLLALLRLSRPTTREFLKECFQLDLETARLSLKTIRSRKDEPPDSSESTVAE